MERELNEANRLIAEAKTHLQEVDLPDEPIATQAKRLRDAHDWQAGIAAGYEKQIQAANETLRKLNDAIHEANTDRLRLREAVRLMYDASPVSYVYACDKARALINSPPPPVVAKVDWDALLNLAEEAAALAARGDDWDDFDNQRLSSVDDQLKTYRNKYQEGNQ
jgi:hypothetical protein